MHKPDRRENHRCPAGRRLGGRRRRSRHSHRLRAHGLHPSPEQGGNRGQEGPGGRHCREEGTVRELFPSSPRTVPEPEGLRGGPALPKYQPLSLDHGRLPSCCRKPITRCGPAPARPRPAEISPSILGSWPPTELLPETDYSLWPGPIIRPSPEKRWSSTAQTRSRLEAKSSPADGSFLTGLPKTDRSQPRP